MEEGTNHVAILASLNRLTFGLHCSYMKKRRYGRSVEDNDGLADILLQASLEDGEDCAKKLVCSLNAQDSTTLAEDEKAIATLFGQNIDMAAATVEFDLAALMGRQAGEQQCQRIYARCQYQAKDLMAAMRQINTNQSNSVY